MTDLAAWLRRHAWDISSGVIALATVVAWHRFGWWAAVLAWLVPLAVYVLTPSARVLWRYWRHHEIEERS